MYMYTTNKSQQGSVHRSVVWRATPLKSFDFVSLPRLI